MKKEYLIIYGNLIGLIVFYFLSKTLNKESLPFVIGLCLSIAGLSSIWLGLIAWTRGVGIFANQGSRYKRPLIFFTYIFGYLFLGAVGFAGGLWLIYSFLAGNVNISL